MGARTIFNASCIVLGDIWEARHHAQSTPFARAISTEICENWVFTTLQTQTLPKSPQDTVVVMFQWRVPHTLVEEQAQSSERFAYLIATFSHPN